MEHLELYHQLSLHFWQIIHYKKILIQYHKQSSDKYTISFNLQKRYNNITFFNTLGKINGNSALFDIPHYTYKINCPNKSSYIFNKMKWLFLIILTVL